MMVVGGGIFGLIWASPLQPMDHSGTPQFPSVQLRHSLLAPAAPSCQPFGGDIAGGGGRMETGGPDMNRGGVDTLIRQVTNYGGHLAGASTGET